MNANAIKLIIKDCLKLNPCGAKIRYNEPMKAHTTFKVGGPADCWLQPRGNGFPSFCAALLRRTREEGIPVFYLGAGANIVVSDKGIRGITLDTRAWKGPLNKAGNMLSGANTVSQGGVDEEELWFKSGTLAHEACLAFLARSRSGLEFLAGMPGTIGGAVWMNARCYGGEIADVFRRAVIITAPDFRVSVFDSNSGFGYKQSPFQNMDCLILSVCFKSRKGSKNKTRAEINKNIDDRKKKGHYLYPSAGSSFKNNHDFGKPSGVIIDELGLKGKKLGGAQVAPYHGNIIINTGNAKAADIRSLVDEITVTVKDKTGFSLDPEILFIGDWE